eukprot:CAMPEP_0196591778 /NCGR_PEP_ID=MMETSP1081-20130531/70838_1 /TAXON_ID=36882 /ORGANISM="Pyramimonas amylifera, Strain CCMP720" /LENGTH=162 /DNA_ID=CAMNT_0041915259 /DNA_START=235 /DNA_END=723 /DNA_ORIENTATION=+
MASLYTRPAAIPQHLLLVTFFLVQLFTTVDATARFRTTPRPEDPIYQKYVLTNTSDVHAPPPSVGYRQVRTTPPDAMAKYNVNYLIYNTKREKKVPIKDEGPLEVLGGFVLLVLAVGFIYVMVLYFPAYELYLNFQHKLHPKPLDFDAKSHMVAARDRIEMQ